MATFDTFYDINPVGVIDRNQWTEQMAEVNLQFRQNAVYTPLIDWSDGGQQSGALTSVETELFEGDVDSNEIPLTQNYIDAMGLDSRSRTFTVKRYGDKVQLHKSSNVFQQWKLSGGRDWRPLLRSVLGQSVLRKHEILSRNVWFNGPKSFWTYSDAGAGPAPTSIGTIAADDRFSLRAVNQWKLRLGQTGAPIVPGTPAQLAIIPPGATYDLMESLPTASGNETALWRDAQIYAGAGLFNYEIGSYKGVRFIEAPNDKFGINPNVLYNTGAIAYQYGVTMPIRMGDGAPDPSTTKVDEVWAVGQQNTTHFIQLEDFASGDFSINDMVTIHVKRTNAYGVTNGVDPFDGRTIVRRVVWVDHVNNRLAFDRPILFNYTSAMVGASVSGATQTTLYAFVTKARHIGFALVLGSRGGVAGKVMQPIQFYEPDPIDDFKSVWRFSYDMILGWNVADPHMYELHFFAVSVPKPGGVG